MSNNKSPKIASGSKNGFGRTASALNQVAAGSYPNLNSKGNETRKNSLANFASNGTSPGTNNTGGLTNVDLNYRKLLEFPTELESSKLEIEKLGLAYNNLSVLPKNIIEFKALTNLNLRSNMFKEFPRVLCHLPNLEILDISRNKLTNLPREPFNFLQIRMLNISKNHITTLPIYFGCMNKLEILKLEGNPIQAHDILSRERQESNKKEWLNHLRLYLKDMERHGRDELNLERGSRQPRINSVSTLNESRRTPNSNNQNGHGINLPVNNQSSNKPISMGHPVGQAHGYHERPPHSETNIRQRRPSQSPNLVYQTESKNENKTSTPTSPTFRNSNSTSYSSMPNGVQIIPPSKPKIIERQQRLGSEAELSETELEESSNLTQPVVKDILSISQKETVSDSVLEQQVSDTLEYEGSESLDVSNDEDINANYELSERDAILNFYSPILPPQPHFHNFEFERSRSVDEGKPSNLIEDQKSSFISRTQSYDRYKLSDPTSFFSPFKVNVRSGDSSFARSGSNESRHESDLNKEVEAKLLAIRQRAASHDSHFSNVTGTSPEARPDKLAYLQKYFYSHADASAYRRSGITYALNQFLFGVYSILEQVGKFFTSKTDPVLTGTYAVCNELAIQLLPQLTAPSQFTITATRKLISNIKELVVIFLKLDRSFDKSSLVRNSLKLQLVNVTSLVAEACQLLNSNKHNLNLPDTFVASPTPLFSLSATSSVTLKQGYKPKLDALVETSPALQPQPFGHTPSREPEELTDPLILAAQMATSSASKLIQTLYAQLAELTESESKTNNADFSEQEGKLVERLQSAEDATHLLVASLNLITANFQPQLDDVPTATPLPLYLRFVSDSQTFIKDATQLIHCFLTTRNLPPSDRVEDTLKNLVLALTKDCKILTQVLVEKIDLKSTGERFPSESEMNQTKSTDDPKVSVS